MAKNCFNIKIFDTENTGAVTTLEQSQKDSIQLVWNGGEEKDVPIIGSNLNFSMLDDRAEDGRFFDLYTGNETRYRVELYTIRLQNNVATEILLWKGFLLPEQYNEPYENGQFFVNFIATCGLGRLKGKTLSDTYYNNSFTYIQFITACLSLTGNQGKLYFSPAIKNKTTKWDSIYINGKVFKEKEKKKNVYQILEIILQDSLCSIFHEYGNWFVLGYNKKISKKITYRVYDLNGVFEETILITRKPIDCSNNALIAPQISVISPLKEITINQSIEEVKIPSSWFQEKSDGWVITAQSSGNYNPRNLFFNNYSPDQSGITWVTVDVKTNKLLLFNFEAFDPTQYLYLRNKIYVTSGQKLKFNSKLSINRSSIDSATSDASLANQGKWNDLIRISILISDFDGATVDQEVVYTLSFNEDRKSISVKDFIVKQSGFLDVRLYRPIGGTEQESIFNIVIDDINIEEVGYIPIETYVNQINEEYSQTREIDITLSDDLKSSTKLLSTKVPRVQNVFRYSQEIPIRNTYFFEGKYYVVVVDFDIFPIKDMNNFVFVKRSGQSNYIKVNNPEIVYNINNSEQNVFTYDINELGFEIQQNDTLKVDFMDYTYPSGDRADNLSWSDDIYQINSKRYAKTIADIYRNLYRESHLSLDVSFTGLYGISTLIAFTYRGKKNYYPLNIEWDVSNGITTGFYNETFYGHEDIEILPISVDAGPDISGNSLDFVNINATATTPNSFIVSILWEKISGDGLLFFTNTLNTQFRIGSTTSVLKITITDNYGQIAIDTVSIIKLTEYTARLIKTRQFSTANLILSDYDFDLSPSLMNNFMTVKYKISAELTTRGYRASSKAGFTVFKNGTNVNHKEYEKPGVDYVVPRTTSYPTETFDIRIGPGDTLKFALSGNIAIDPLLGGGARVLIRVQILDITFDINDSTARIISGTQAAGITIGVL